MKILIVAGLPDFLPTARYDRIIGVDRGALWTLENGLALNLALGDFDSVSHEEFEKIRLSADKVISLPVVKDQTDLEAALEVAVFGEDNENSSVQPNTEKAEITVLGALGGRLDHELTNLYLPTRARFRPWIAQITLVNAQNRVSYLSAGTHTLKRLPGYHYIGFQKLSAQNFAITGAKYDLSAAANFADIYASNEFIADSLTVRFTSGVVIVIYSKDVERNF